MSTPAEVVDNSFIMLIIRNSGPIYMYGYHKCYEEGNPSMKHWFHP